MAPDFHYFFNLGPNRRFAHSIQAAFVYALPVSLLVLWLFQTFMKEPLISLAPERQQAKLAAFARPFRWWPAGRFIFIVFSILVGIGTHLVWDSLTHEQGLMVRNFADLRAPAINEFGSERPLYNVLQHTGTFLGMAIVALWYWRWVRRAPEQTVPERLRMKPQTKAAITTLILVSSVLLSLVFAYLRARHSPIMRPLFVAWFAISMMSLISSEAFIYCLLWRWKDDRWRKA